MKTTVVRTAGGGEKRKFDEEEKLKAIPVLEAVSIKRKEFGYCPKSGCFAQDRPSQENEIKHLSQNILGEKISYRTGSVRM